MNYRNFRPNILVQGGEPFAEDAWRDIQIGAIRFTNVKPCTRCTFTTVLSDRGVKHPNSEPLRTLRTFRIKDESKHLYEDDPLFGVNLVPHNEGLISLTDSIKLE